jgi:hypothetical protein
MKILTKLAIGTLLISAVGSPLTLAQSTYDPYSMMRTNQSHQGFLQVMREHMNPSNENYGNVILSSEQVLIESTIRAADFWLAVIALILLSISCLYIYYLRRDRRRRLIISAEVLAQASNCYIHARNKALEAITAYNKLVKEKDAAYIATLAPTVLDRPEFATQADVYRQPDAVAEQRMNPTISPVLDASDPFSIANIESQSAGLGAALNKTAPTDEESLSDTDSESEKVVEYREPSSLEHASRMIKTLQRKIQNLRTALNLSQQRERELSEKLHKYEAI